LLGLNRKRKVGREKRKERKKEKKEKKKKKKKKRKKKRKKKAIPISGFFLSACPEDMVPNRVLYNCL